ncbi:MAG: alpha/beta hydrolase [Chloroflexota bacterium]
MKGCLRIFGYVALGFAGLLVFVIGIWTVRTNNQVDASETDLYTTHAPGQIVEIDGLDFHVVVIGEVSDERPLLLLHGFGLNASKVWLPIQPLLAEERQLIIPDFLGMGHSQRLTEPNEAYTHQKRSEHLALLLDELNIEQVDIVGASFGGGIGTQFSLDYPERVNQLVLIGAQVYQSGGGFFEALGNLPLGIGRAMTWFALGAGPLNVGGITSGCESGGYCPSAEEVEIWMQPLRIQGSTDALGAMSGTAFNGRIPEDVPQVSQETLIIWGEFDNIISIEEGRRLDQEIPNSTFEMIDGAGHSPYFEQPELVASLLLAFFDK